jgi:hypothetical protein
MDVLGAPLDFAEWALNRIYFRSSSLQKFNEKMNTRLETRRNRKLANNNAKGWAQHTGAGSFAKKQKAQEYFDFSQELIDGSDGISGFDRKMAKTDAAKWAKKVGANPEAEKEYADSILTRKVIGTDFDRLTRNEFKKKYPHIKTPEYTADLAHRRPSVARLIKAVRGQRVPSIAEQNAFFDQIRSPQFKIGKPLSF